MRAGPERAAGKGFRLRQPEQVSVRSHPGHSERRSPHPPPVRTERRREHVASGYQACIHFWSDQAKPGLDGPFAA
ncbi:hypothetical protein GCM10009605_18000 [Nocardiopsis composta]